MAEVFTAEDVQRLGMSPEMIGTPKEPTFVPADPRAVTLDTIDPSLVMDRSPMIDPVSYIPPANSAAQQAELVAAIGSRATPTPMKTVASDLTAPAAAGILQQPTQPARSDDMFGNLSKQQRMMLAFSAISDAGMAAQGKQGTSFTDTLRAFSGMEDIKRKREAAANLLEQEKLKQAQVNALFTGGMGPQGATQDMAMMETSDQAQQKISQLVSQLGAYAQLGQMDAYQAKMDQLVDQRDRLLGQEAEEAGKIEVAEGQLEQARFGLKKAGDALVAATGMTLEEIQAEVAKGDAGDIDGSRFVRSRYLFEGDRYKNFKSAAQTLASIMTFQNLSSVIASGAKLGILSDSDMRILGNMSGVIDVENMPQQSADTIFSIFGKLQRTVEAIEGQLTPDDVLNQKLKKYGLDK